MTKNGTLQLFTSSSTLPHFKEDDARHTTFLLLAYHFVRQNDLLGVVGKSGELPEEIAEGHWFAASEFNQQIDRV